MRLGRPRRGALRALTLIAVVIVMVTATAAAMADWFGPVSYDPNGNQLIVTMMYEGTNPHHHFSIKWYQCLELDRSGGKFAPRDSPAVPPHQIGVWIVDNQGSDLAK